MKQLYLLRGIPGSGKSTLIKNIPEGYVISADRIRMLFSPAVCDKNTLRYCINPDNDKQVWNFIHDLVKQRLLNGHTTVVDATHCNIKSIDYYKSFCSQNNICCTVVQFNTPLEVCKLQNKQRGKIYIVPENVLERMHENMADPVPSWCNVITSEEFGDIIEKSFSKTPNTPYSPLDYNKFEKIVIFGDIHGCYEPLKEYFENNPISENTKYIFVGDYEDRGIQNREVFEFLLNHKSDSNFLFLKGNHTLHTLCYSLDKDIVSKEFRTRTLEQLKDFNKKDLKKFCLKQADFSYFTFGGQKFLVTHGGPDKLPTPFINERHLVHGVGNYEHSEIVDENFHKNFPDVISVHGHRNLNNINIQFGAKKGYFNLEGQVEFGGCLRILEINKDFENKVFINTVEIKNNVFRVIGSDEDIISQLENSRFVKVSELEDGIKSYKFTRDCFFNKKWDNLTEKARGLFCRGTKVVARSFDKFFNIGERESLEEISHKMTYPISVYKKENGYLGIVSYDKNTDKLFVSSKSTNKSDYANYFKKLLENSISDNISLHKRLERFLKERDISLVFEVCDSSLDPHIVEYDKPEIYLLEAFNNSLKEETINYESLLEISNSICIPCKSLVTKLESEERLLDFINSLESDHMDSNKYEGFVLEGQNHYRVKYKTKWYRFWKIVRNSIEGNKEIKVNFPAEEIEDKLKIISNVKDTKNYYCKNLIGLDTFNVIKFRKSLED